MVKLDLEVNEIIGLAETGRIDKIKLKKFLTQAKREELEDFLVSEYGKTEDDDINDLDDIDDDDLDDDLDEDKIEDKIEDKEDF